MSLNLTVTNTLALRRPTKNNPLPAVVVFADNQGNILGNIDTAIVERAQLLMTKADFKGALSESVCDYAVADKSLPVLVVVGVGAIEKLADNVQKVAYATYTAIKNQAKAVIAWGDVICQQHFTQFISALLYKAYRFDRYKTDVGQKPTLQAVEFVNNKDELSAYQEALLFAQAVSVGQGVARDVANEPPNVCNPSYMAKQAKQLAKDYPDLVEVSVLDEKKMQKLGMGCFLSVAAGSSQEGKMVVIEYFGKSKKSAKSKLQNPIALVGKGITFDSGGISIKPSAGMDEMKFDMGGAAAMLGTIKGVCEAKLPLDMVVVLACAENMPSGDATRPGDVVTAMNGTTVEILNTDAEGRLVLCDALCYVQENYQPKVVIDAATLTGACVIALGSVHAAVYSNDEDTLFALQAASGTSNDGIWHMPLGESYAEQLKSSVADLQNIGGRKAGSVTAACFLQHFIKKEQAWVHLDIAGVAWEEGTNKGATGRPVPLLMHYLRSQLD